MPDRWGTCQIKIRWQPDRSGCCLIKIWQLPDRSGTCQIKIRWQPDWSGCCLIKIRHAWYQANLSAWSILLRQIRRSGKRRKFVRSLVAARAVQCSGCLARLQEDSHHETVQHSGTERGLYRDGITGVCLWEELLAGEALWAMCSNRTLTWLCRPGMILFSSRLYCKTFDPKKNILFGQYITQGAQVSTHVALDHQTYSALAQNTQITWTAQLKCDEH